MMISRCSSASVCVSIKWKVNELVQFVMNGDAWRFIQPWRQVRAQWRHVPLRFFPIFFISEFFCDSVINFFLSVTHYLQRKGRSKKNKNKNKRYRERKMKKKNVVINFRVDFTSALKCWRLDILLHLMYSRFFGIL